MTLRVMVVDDERLARQRLRRLLREEGVDVVAECADGREAVAALREHAPDLVFLDVQMPELDGFGVLAEVGADRMPGVVFVTAYDQYAVRAFEVSALDYLLKPFDAERFRKAFRRARAALEREEATAQQTRLAALLERLAAGVGAGGADASHAGTPALPVAAASAASAASAAADGVDAPPDGSGALAHPRRAPGGGKYLERLLIKSGGRVFFVRVSEIDWIEAAGNYLRLHVGRDAHLVRETMSTIEAKLDPAQFLRVHRSTIVRTDCIREMQPWFSGEYVIILRDGTRLKLSRSYREQVAQQLGQEF
jgi:two-component system, LytTR family, response regulator